MKRHVLGVDPGLKTGFAAFDSAEGRLTRVSTLTFWRCHDLVLSEYPPAETIVVVEDPNMNRRALYARNDRFAGRVRDKVARNAGSVGAEARLLIERFESKGYEVVRVRPWTKKWDEWNFRRVTGWEGRSSEHSRDAAKLIYMM